MRGFAIVDGQQGGDEIAVWITNRTEPQRASNVNAVVVERPDIEDKVRSLTRMSAVVLIDGSNLAGFHIENTLSLADFDDFVEETRRLQNAIIDAVAAHRKRTRGKVSDPVLPALPHRKDFEPEDDSARSRAFAGANFVAAAWTAWLQTDEQRRRRTVRPKTGETPWIMPEDLNEPEVAPLPPEFARRLHIQPLV